MANYKCQCYRGIKPDVRTIIGRYVSVYAWEWKSGRKVCLFCGKPFPVYCLARDWAEADDDRHPSTERAR